MVGPRPAGAEPHAEGSARAQARSRSLCHTGFSIGDSSMLRESCPRCTGLRRAKRKRPAERADLAEERSVVKKQPQVMMMRCASLKWSRGVARSIRKRCVQQDYKL